MKQTITFILISGIVATTCSAYLLPVELLPTFDESVETETKRISEEAIQAGLILREVAQELSKDVSETDEYFFRALWEQAKESVRKAGEKIGNAAKDAVDDLTSTMKKVGETVKEKAKETALQVMGKIFSKMMESYAANDNESKDDLVELLSKMIAEAAERFIKEGQRLITK